MHAKGDMGAFQWPVEENRDRALHISAAHKAPPSLLGAN